MYTMKERRWLMRITVLVCCLRLCENRRSISQGQYCDESFTVIIPKSNDCSTFFRCVNSTWNNYKCPLAGVFSQKYGMCTRPENNSRCNRPTTDFSGLTPVTDECIYPCPEDGSVYMYPKWGTCDQFYVCKDRQLYSAACSDIPPRGTYRFFNFFMFSCDRAAESNNVCKRAMLAG